MVRRKLLWLSSLLLIVDDSPLVRTTLERTFGPLAAQRGFALRTADSAATVPYELANTLLGAILDYDLGDGFGNHVAQNLRDQNGALPIAFFSASLEATPELLRYGPVFAKPEGLPALLSWVESFAVK
jgi:DNA-binding response OmpR family regulator